MSDTETHQHTIAGLLHRRREIIEKITAMRDQIGVMANDVEAIDRVLEELGYSGMLEAVPSLPRRVIFYRGELRQWLLAQLREHGPATSRTLAERLAQVQRKDLRDKKLINDLTNRIGKRMNDMQAARLVVGERGNRRSENLWKLIT